MFLFDGVIMSLSKLMNTESSYWRFESSQVMTLQSPKLKWRHFLRKSRHWTKSCQHDNFRCSNDGNFAALQVTCLYAFPFMKTFEFAEHATCHHLNQRWQSLLACMCVTRYRWMNTLRPRQNGRHFPVDIFKCIFLTENVWIFIKISLKFVPKGPINKIPSLVQIMAWRRWGAKPLSEPMMVSLLTHICVTRPQWFRHLQINTAWILHALLTFVLLKWRWWHARLAPVYQLQETPSVSIAFV